MSRPPPPPAVAQQSTKQPTVGAPPTAQTEDFAAPEAPHGQVEDEIHDLYSSVNMQALMQYNEGNPNAPNPLKSGNSSVPPVPPGSGVAGPGVKGSTPVAPITAATKPAITTQPTKPGTYCLVSNSEGGRADCIFSSRTRLSTCWGDCSACDWKSADRRWWNQEMSFWYWVCLEDDGRKSASRSY